MEKSIFLRANNKEKHQKTPVLSDYAFNIISNTGLSLGEYQLLKCKINNKVLPFYVYDYLNNSKTHKIRKNYIIISN